ncbi:MAG TPA: GYD domain-containing protein [Streptosporangiaceae bacterium]|nr:GYD domain-containing protein [Streptosporangiaceae bacterium]
MARFLIKFTYSSASWARMINVADDRTRAGRVLMESLGGSLERIDWDLENGAAYAVAELPDSVTAAAVLTATAKTGAFAGVEAHELLTQEQMHDALMLARDAALVYQPPGSAATEPGSGSRSVDGRQPVP